MAFLEGKVQGTMKPKLASPPASGAIMSVLLRKNLNTVSQAAYKTESVKNDVRRNRQFSGK